MRVLFFLVVLVAGCATAPDPAPKPEAPTAPAVEPAPPPRAENIAVAGLLDSARSDAAAGKLVTATASLERALRIEPRNPRLWQELARVRLKQGQFAQAESVAARSNSWAGDDKDLRAENWRLIAESRRARGDHEGAQTALEQAARIR